MDLTHDDILVKIEKELRSLDDYLVQVNGIPIKPSQCYHVGVNPAHILFNTNCPEMVRQKVLAILAKHIPAGESGS